MYTHRLGKISSSKQQDQATISELEKKLKNEIDVRSRVEAEFRNHQHVSRNSYSAEEVKQLTDKLRKLERELENALKENLKKEKTWEDIKKELSSHRMSLRMMEGEKQQLKISLADETRVKIELFTALSDAGRKQQSLLEECIRKNMEINRLRQNLAEVMAIIPAHPSTPQPTTVYPPASSPGVYPLASSPGVYPSASSPGVYPPASSPQQ